MSLTGKADRTDIQKPSLLGCGTDEKSLVSGRHSKARPAGRVLS